VSDHGANIVQLLSFSTSTATLNKKSAVKRMRRLIAVTLFCAFVLGGSGLVAWYVYNAETRQIEAGFQRDITRRAHQLENELVKLRATMRYWRKFYETSRTPIQLEQFRSIATDVLKTYPSLQIIGWAPVVPKAQRAAFEQQFKRAYPQFSIFTLRPERNIVMSEQELQHTSRNFDPRQFFEPAGEQPYYLPMAVLEPRERIGFLTGLDVSGINQVTVAKHVAHTRDSGSNDIVTLPAIPSPFSPNHEPIMVALVPVYVGDAGSTAERRDTLQGFIATIFSLEELVRISSMSDQPKDIGVQLVDRSQDAAVKVLYRYGAKIQRGMAYQRPIADVLGRRWFLVASPSAAYIASRRTLVPYLTMLGGVVFAGMFVWYFNLTQRQTERVQAEVDSRTRELRLANEELNVLNERLKFLSRIDSLTEVANRRFFNETLQCEWRRAAREGQSLAVLLIDVDHFKRFNDHYGHLRGDECLQNVAKALQGAVRRGGDLVARYGGEEFAVILPCAGREAIHAAERCRAAVEALRIPHAQAEGIDHVTVSVGMSSVVPNGDTTLDDLLDSADAGLYEAKDTGRNRVIYTPCRARVLRSNAALLSTR